MVSMVLKEKEKKMQCPLRTNLVYGERANTLNGRLDYMLTNFY